MIVNLKLSDQLKNISLGFQWEPIQHFEGILACKLENKGDIYLSNLIPDRFINGLRFDTPLFIATQTGTGKTTFIFNNLVNLVSSRGKRILYLVPRSALKKKIKEEAKKNTIIKDTRMAKYSCNVGDVDKYLMPLAQEKEYDYGLIDILSYQEFYNYREKLAWDSYDFVIFDEVHALMSDATFNAETELIFQEMLEKTENIKRIYISATPDLIIDKIYRKEKAFLERTYHRWLAGGLEPALYFLAMDENYEKYNFYFFSNLQSVYDVVKNDTSKKYLFFVNSIREGEQITNEFSDDASFIHSKSDRGRNSVYNQISETDDFKSRVLVATKVIDAGISLTSENIGGICIDLYDITDIKQMIGRKRMGKNDTLNVYFKIPSIDTVRHRIECLTEKIKKENALEKQTQILRSQPSNQLDHPLYYLNGKICCNKFSIDKLNEELEYYNKMEKELNNVLEDRYAYYQTYINFFLKEFSTVSISGQIIEAESKEYLDSGLAPYLEMEEIREDDLEAIFSIMETVVGTLRKDERSRDTEMDKKNGRPTNALNKRLKEFNYRLVREKSSGLLKLTKVNKQKNLKEE